MSFIQYIIGKFKKPIQEGTGADGRIEIWSGGKKIVDQRGSFNGVIEKTNEGTVIRYRS